MTKDRKPYIKLEKEYINKYMFNVKTEVDGSKEDIAEMTVCLLSSLFEGDKELVVKILMKFMEGIK